LFWIPATSHKWVGIFLLFLNAQHCPNIWQKKIIYLLKTDWVSTGTIHMLCTKRWTYIKYNKDIVSKMFYYSIYCTLLLSFGCKIKRKISTHETTSTRNYWTIPQHIFQTPPYCLRPDPFSQTFKYFRFYKHTRT
jgi:hypothetical protein